MLFCFITGDSIHREKKIVQFLATQLTDTLKGIQVEYTN
jgi:hypothetical protein